MSMTVEDYFWAHKKEARPCVPLVEELEGNKSLELPAGTELKIGGGRVMVLMEKGHVLVVSFRGEEVRGFWVLPGDVFREQYKVEEKPRVVPYWPMQQIFPLRKQPGLDNG